MACHNCSHFCIILSWINELDFFILPQSWQFGSRTILDVSSSHIFSLIKIRLIFKVRDDVGIFLEKFPDFSKRSCSWGRTERNAKAKVAVDRGGPAAHPLQLRWKFERIARACKPDWRDRESHRHRRHRRIVVAFSVLRANHARRTSEK